MSAIALGSIATFALVIARGLLLWVIVPLGVLAWPFVWAGSTRRPTMGSFLGWLDVNLIATLQHTIFRPVFPERTPWLPVTEIRTTIPQGQFMVQ